MGASRRRRLFRLLLIPAVLLVLGVLVLRMLFPAEKVQQLAVDRIAAATGARVQLGDASLAFWPRLKLVLADGSIAGTGEALRAASGAEVDVESYRIELDRLEIDLAIGPLLQKRIETGQIRLIQPRVHLVVRAPVSPDEAGVKKPAAGAGQSAAGGVEALPWEFAVAGLEVRDGSLSLQQAGGGPSVVVEGWQQDVSCTDMANLLAGLIVFQGGKGDSGARPATTLYLETRLARVVVSDLPLDPARPDAPAPGPLELHDLSLSASLEVPATADQLLVTIESLKWGAVDLQGDAVVVSAPEPGSYLTEVKWRSADVELSALFADLRPMLTVPDAQLTAWLDTDPIHAGSIVFGGALTLTTPTPPDWQPDDVLAAMTMTASLRGGRLALVEPMAGVEAGIAAELSIAGGEARLHLQELEVGDGALRGAGTCRMPLPGLPGRLHADFEGEADLFALTEVAPDLVRLPAADGDALRLGGRLTWQAKARGLDPELLADPLAMQLLLESGGFEGLTISAKVADLVFGGAMPGPDWRVAGLSVSSDLRSVDFSAAGISHPVLNGGVSGHVSQVFPRPLCRVDLQADTVDLDRMIEIFAAPEQTASLAGRGTFAVAVAQVLDAVVSTARAADGDGAATPPPGDLIPADLRVDFNVGAERVVLQKALYTSVEMSGNLDERVIDVQSLSAGRGTGEIVGSGTVDYAADPWGNLEFTMEVLEVPAGELLSPWASDVAAIWHGAVSAVFSGACSLRDENAILQSLRIEGDALSTSGSVDLTSWLEGVDSVLGEQQDLKLVRYKEFAHHLLLQDGRYRIDGLLLRGLDTDWFGNGWIGLDGGIDLHLNVRFPGDFRPDLGNLTFMADALRDDEGRIVLDLHLSGRAAKPKVDLDLSAAKAAAKDSLGKEVKKGINSLLDKLKGK